MPLRPGVISWWASSKSPTAAAREGSNHHFPGQRPVASSHAPISELPKKKKPACSSLSNQSNGMRPNRWPGIDEKMQSSTNQAAQALTQKAGCRSRCRHWLGRAEWGWVLGEDGGGVGAGLRTRLSSCFSILVRGVH